MVAVRTGSRLRVGVGRVCACFGVTRDAYYKLAKRLTRRRAVADRVVELVQEERRLQPRVGTRKLHVAMREQLGAEGIRMGRDKLFTLLRERGLLVAPRRASCRTTNSYHRFHKYGNCIRGMQVTRPNQVWVSDITYIRTARGFCYLALVTDLYSRRVLGYDVSDSLELAGCLRALKLALQVARPAPGLIHHSDRGVQYCSAAYIECLYKNGISPSMTQEHHCYENAVAERVNGILKDEFFLDQCFLDLKQARKAAADAVRIYNFKRLHVSLGYKTPDVVFKSVA
ncbi:MAG TPA: IS3 family transposase [Tenuifilaceae bacterium]|nr:IS3 family transposase [Tenuifilaceae bacterium]HRC94803.1 IS3 family transposase [Tenuifilaceae bacterium]